MILIPEEPGIPPALAVAGGDGGLMRKTIKGISVVHAGGKELPAAGIAGFGSVCILCAQRGESGDDGVFSVTGPEILSLIFFLSSFFYLFFLSLSSLPLPLPLPIGQSLFFFCIFSFSSLHK